MIKELLKDVLIIAIIIVFGFYYQDYQENRIAIKINKIKQNEDFISKNNKRYDEKLSDFYCLGNNINVPNLVLIDDYDPYLILNESYDLTAYYKVNEAYKLNVSYRYDHSKAEIKDDILVPKENGELSILVVARGKAVKLEFLVTDLICQMPKDDNFEKEDLPCGIFSEEDNDLLDEILRYRVDKAGYKTRAGVLAASRFLLLEFPYHMEYFYEYGRRTYGNIDGEGRYYLEGLYLSESRFERLMGSNTTPATWGCPLYSFMSLKEEINGLDCSGFVTWVLLNSGFDCGDIGAGITEYYDLTNTGELKKNSLDMIKEIKAGDLVHNTYMDGHIGIIIGINDKNIYVAQATPKNHIGVGVSKYTYEEFIREWNETVLMDSYYLEDGNYTNMW